MAGTYTKINLEGNRICVYCGVKRGATWDHVYPVSSVASALAGVGVERALRRSPFSTPLVSLRCWPVSDTVRAK
jgi:hypothetical protein